MSEIKPIETEYNGKLFRSRLEARWAVFFDSAGVRYEYEPDSFMAGGIGYVPDFYLPELDQYVEVKPYRPGAFLEIGRSLGVIGTGKIKSLLILTNLPEGVNCMFAYPIIYKHPVSNIVVERFYLGRSKKGICFLPTENHYVVIDYYCDREEELFQIEKMDHEGDFRETDLHECFTRAKAYRFD